MAKTFKTEFQAKTHAKKTIKEAKLSKAKINIQWAYNSLKSTYSYKDKYDYYYLIESKEINITCGNPDYDLMYFIENNKQGSYYVYAYGKTIKSAIKNYVVKIKKEIDKLNNNLLKLN